ncbi:MAG: DNA-binding protein Alba [Candidatus ainarchaeum sp.]|nr:DNA-binding protein Alba [Candidatus ainarchaeum sp.]
MAKDGKEQSKNEGNFVFVGKKGVMAYVLAVITQMSEGAKEVTVKARGKSISRAVDVAEIVRNKSQEIKLSGIEISTEEVETEDGKPLKISAIAIKLKK